MPINSKTLAEKVEHLKYLVPSGVLPRIVDRREEGARELSDLIQQLEISLMLHGRKPIARTETRIPIRIVQLCEHEAGITIGCIMSPNRHQDIITARIKAQCLVFRYANWSLLEIGRFFDRNHTSILEVIAANPDLSGYQGKFKPRQKVHHHGR